MKSITINLIGLFCAALLITNAADKKPVGGPQGGRFLEKTEPSAEFVVEKDYTVKINFYDSARKPLPAGNQSATVVAETKGGKERIDFEKRGDSLVSKTRLPEGDGYNLVVQFKQAPDAKPVNYRFKLDLHTCAGCKRAEYACTCDEH